MFEIVEMTEEYAEAISKWTYLPPYEIYSMKPTDEEIDQLMNGLHVAVVDGENLVGFAAFGWSAQVVCPESEEMYMDESYTDVAFGLKPQLCDRGLGLELVKCSVDYIKELFPEDGVRLTVRKDNIRAQKVYEKAGFSKNFEFSCGKDGFVTMVL